MQPTLLINAFILCFRNLTGNGRIDKARDPQLSAIRNKLAAKCHFQSWCAFRDLGFGAGGRRRRRVLPARNSKPAAPLILSPGTSSAKQLRLCKRDSRGLRLSVTTIRGRRSFRCLGPRALACRSSKKESYLPLGRAGNGWCGRDDDDTGATSRSVSTGFDPTVGVCDRQSPSHCQCRHPSSLDALIVEEHC